MKLEVGSHEVRSKKSEVMKFRSRKSGSKESEVRSHDVRSMKS